MPNFVKPLRDEIARLAKKEVAQSLGQIKKALSALKAENKFLKKELAAIKKTAQVLKKNVPQGNEPESCSADELRSARFTPAIIIRLRKKFGLSRLKMAQLLGINNKSISRWEEGIGEPKTNSRTKLISLRKMTKRDVKKQLQELKAANKVKKTVVKKAVKKPAAKKSVKKAAKKIQKKVAFATVTAMPAANNSGNTTN